MSPTNVMSSLFFLGLALTLVGIPLTMAHNYKTLVGIPLTMAHNSPAEYLCAHNEVRSKVGVEPLVWNKTLAKMAQSYAESKRATCEMVHSDGPEGENLAMGYKEMSAKTAVGLWAGEKKYYYHDSNTCGDDPNHCLHYTQVVWKKTTSVGCGQVKCENNWVFVVCNYHPPGNYIGQNPY